MVLSIRYRVCGYSCCCKIGTLERKFKENEKLLNLSPERKYEYDVMGIILMKLV